MRMQCSALRTVVLLGKDREHMKHIIDALCDKYQPHVADIVQPDRVAGLRLREVILADRLRREAEQLGKINIQDGTKIGRSGPFASCWIDLNSEIRAALVFAKEISPVGSINVLARNETYVGFIREVARPRNDSSMCPQLT